MTLFKSLMTATVLAGTALAPFLAQSGSLRAGLAFQTATAGDQQAELVNFVVKKKKGDAKNRKMRGDRDDRGSGSGSNSSSKSSSNISSNSSSNSSSSSSSNSSSNSSSGGARSRGKR